MQVNVQEQIKQHPELAAAVDRATKVLEAQLGPSRNVVTVAWSMGQDRRNGPEIDLKVSDPETSVERHFAPEELNNPEQMERSLIRLWGDLLQDRSHKQLARLKRLVQELEGD
jgi:hypothetical protein